MGSVMSSGVARAMRTNAMTSPESDSHRYKAVLRISEAIAACREPEELARTLADEIGKFLEFDHLYFVVLKQTSTEIEYLVCGKGPLPFPDLPLEEWPVWEAVRSGEPQHTVDWDTEKRYPRFKEWAKKIGLGSGVRIPLTTPHRRLGVFGINRDTVNPFGEEEIGFLHLIGRVVAFALDDGLNLRRSQQHNERLTLLLNLTSRITSNLKIRELLRDTAANIREVMHCDAVGVSVLDSASGMTKVCALDFPHGKGFLKEEELLAVSGVGKRVLETLKPTIVNPLDPCNYTPEILEKVVAEGFTSH